MIGPRCLRRFLGDTDRCQLDNRHQGHHRCGSVVWADDDRLISGPTWAEDAYRRRAVSLDESQQSRKVQNHQEGE